MKAKMNLLLVCSVVVATLLVGCGGSSDDGAGSLTAFSVAPTAKSVTGPVGACYSGFVGRFYVSGGTPPYRVGLSDPDVFSFTDPLVAMTPTIQIGSRDGYFDVWSQALCVDPSSVIIFDDMGRRITASLVNKVGE